MPDRPPLHPGRFAGGISMPPEPGRSDRRDSQSSAGAPVAEQQKPPIQPAYIGSPRAMEFDPLAPSFSERVFDTGDPFANSNGNGSHAFPSDPFAQPSFPVDPFADDPFALPPSSSSAGAAAGHASRDSIDLAFLFMGDQQPQPQLEGAINPQSHPQEDDFSDDEDDDDEEDDAAQDPEEIRAHKAAAIQRLFARTEFPKSPRLAGLRRLPGAVPALPVHPSAVPGLPKSSPPSASLSPLPPATQTLDGSGGGGESDHDLELEIPEIFFLGIDDDAADAAAQNSKHSDANPAAPAKVVPVASARPPTPSALPPVAAAAPAAPVTPPPKTVVSLPGQPSGPAAPAGNSPGKEQPQLIRKMLIDVLGFMKDGSPFLKYGRRGYPKFRYVQISEDCQRLVWFSDNKALRDTQIRLADVVELRAGQTTKVFRRMPSDELSSASLSLIYRRPAKSSGRRRLSFGRSNNHGGSSEELHDPMARAEFGDTADLQSFDIVAKDPNEYAIWFAGLSELLRLHRAEKLREPPAQLLLELPIRRGRRSSVGLIDHATGEEAFDPVAATELAKLRNSRAGEDGSKLDYRKTHERLLAFKEDVKALREKLRKPKYRNHPSFPALRTMFYKTKKALLMSADNYRGGDFVSCEDDLWRGRVNYSAVKTMLAAVKHH